MRQPLPKPFALRSRRTGIVNASGMSSADRSSSRSSKSYRYSLVAVICYMLTRICMVQVQRRKCMPDHADYSVLTTRQHELDRADQAIIQIRNISTVLHPKVIRSSSGNRLSTCPSVPCVRRCIMLATYTLARLTTLLYVPCLLSCRVFLCAL